MTSQVAGVKRSIDLLRRLAQGSLEVRIRSDLAAVNILQIVQHCLFKLAIIDLNSYGGAAFICLDGDVVMTALKWCIDR